MPPVTIWLRIAIALALAQSLPFGSRPGAAAVGTTRTVKAAGGGTCTVIQTCINLMSASGGDTTVVYAGTYAETPTLKAGTAGAAHWDQSKANVVMVNPGDTVNVLAFTMASHTTLNGFVITNPGTPFGTNCIEVPGNTTDFKISNNNMTACGNRALVNENVSFASTNYGWITGNTGSYSCSTAGAPNVCEGLYINGDYHIIEGNNFSHLSDVMTMFGSHNVVRNNNWHDMTSADCGSHSSNCHIDFIESEPVNVAGGVTRPNQYNLVENNTFITNVGSNAHGYLTQADGCNNLCFYWINRFNYYAHIGTFGIINDNSGSLAVNGFYHEVSYNNTWADVLANAGQIAINGMAQNGSLYAATINELFYVPGNASNLSPYYVDASSNTGFTPSNNLAWCTGACSFKNRTNGGTFVADAPGNIQADPLLTNYAANDFSTQALSPARQAGTNLTKAVGAGAASTTLTVTDSAFFSDGSGIVNADWIRIGTSTTVQIASINYSTNVLTLVSPVTWSNNDPIYLYKDSSGNIKLLHTAPDIGAYQAP